MLGVNSRYIKLKNGLGLRHLREGTNGKIKIFFFPFVGGQSLSFKELANLLPNDIDVFAIDPPGHGFGERYYINNFKEMIELMYDELKEYFTNDFYLFGHSLGGIIVYRMTQLLEEENIRPKKIILSASPVPHRVEEYEYIREKTMNELFGFLGEFGGIDSRLLNSDKYLKFYYQIIKSDIEVFLTTKVSNSKIIKTPMSVIYSEGDSFVKYTDIFEWGIYGEEVSFNKVSGNHMFIQSQHQEVAKILTSLLK